MAILKREPVLDMKTLAQHIEQGPQEYAPPSIRLTSDNNVVIQQVLSFGALPTKELDEIVAAAKEQIAELERECQQVRDNYVRNTKRIVADIKRLQLGVAASMDMMKALREECAKLNTINPEEDVEYKR